MKDPEKILIVGIGNEFRGDDAVGLRIVDLLSAKHPNLADYLTLQSDLTQLLELWSHRHVIIIDAAFSRHFQPGRIHMVCSLEDLITDKEHHYSTHGLGLIEVLRMGKLLHNTPESLFFLGVEGDSWEFGKPLSQKVEEVIPLVEWRVIDYVKNNLTKCIPIESDV